MRKTAALCFIGLTLCTSLRLAAGARSGDAVRPAAHGDEIRDIQGCPKTQPYVATVNRYRSPTRLKNVVDAKSFANALAALSASIAACADHTYSDETLPPDTRHATAGALGVYALTLIEQSLRLHDGLRACAERNADAAVARQEYALQGRYPLEPRQIDFVRRLKASMNASIGHRCVL